MGYGLFIGFEAILAAYDGSPQSEHALQMALFLAKRTLPKVPIFSAARIPEPALRAGLNAVLGEARGTNEVLWSETVQHHFFTLPVHTRTYSKEAA